VVSVDDGTDRSVTQIVRALREANPRVFVGADRLSEGEFTVNPMCLDDGEVEYVIERIVAAATGTTARA
jgi:L-seryl-tRNA(Ser) seleniumtransferase